VGIGGKMKVEEREVIEMIGIKGKGGEEPKGEGREGGERKGKEK